MQSKRAAEPTDETTDEPTETPNDGPTDEPTDEPTDAPTYAIIADPICPPQIDVEVTYIPNHDDCSAYYECDNGVPAPMYCPDGPNFCSETQTCVWVWEPGSIYDCIIVKKVKPAAVYDNGDIAKVTNHRNAILEQMIGEYHCRNISIKINS